MNKQRIFVYFCPCTQHNTRHMVGFQCIFSECIIGTQKYLLGGYNGGQMTRKCSISEILTSYFLTSKTCPFSFLRFWFSSPWHLTEMSSLYISIATKSLNVLMVSLPFPLNLHQFLVQTLNLHFHFLKKIQPWTKFCCHKYPVVTATENTTPG